MLWKEVGINSNYIIKTFSMLNVTIIVTTKKLCIQHTYKELRRESKYFTTHTQTHTHTQLTKIKTVMEKNEE